MVCAATKTCITILAGSSMAQLATLASFASATSVARGGYFSIVKTLLLVVVMVESVLPTFFLRAAAAGDAVGCY